MQEQISYVKVKDLKLNDRNPRKNDAAVEVVAKSIEKYGFKNPCIIDKDNVVWCGNTRLKAARRLGIEEVPCIVVEDLTEEQIREYALLDNKTNEIAEWDYDLLADELGELDLDDFDLDWGLDDFEEAEKEVDILEQKKQEFEERMKAGELSEDDEAYQEFLAKFEAKKTTDDCYTPPIVYEAVADYVSEHYGLNKVNFVRPFVPQGDYQAEKYKPTDVVVDNPPFSILAEIINFYNEHGIKFFLFAPQLTIFSAAASSSSSCILCGVTITYENGANVSTSFVTNLEDCAFRSAPKLYKAVKKANDDNPKQTKVQLPKYGYPLDCVLSPMITPYSRLGIDFEVAKDECYFIRQLDSQKESGKSLFGSGYLISERKKAEREKAEREKAEREKVEREKVERWELSEREKGIIKTLK